MKLLREREAVSRRGKLAVILSALKPLAGSLGEEYLRFRGLEGGPWRDLLYCPPLRMGEGLGVPALCFALRDGSRRLRGVHLRRIELPSLGVGEGPKSWTYGSASDSFYQALPLDPVMSERVLLMEAPLEALSLVFVLGDRLLEAGYTVWGLCTKECKPLLAALLVRFGLEPFLGFDRDAAGSQAAWEWRFLLQSYGVRKVRFVWVPAPYKDFNELLMKEGRDSRSWEEVWQQLSG